MTVRNNDDIEKAEITAKKLRDASCEAIEKLFQLIKIQKTIITSETFKYKSSELRWEKLAVELAEALVKIENCGIPVGSTGAVVDRYLGIVEISHEALAKYRKATGDK